MVFNSSSDVLYLLVTQPAKGLPVRTSMIAKSAGRLFSLAFRWHCNYLLELKSKRAPENFFCAHLCIQISARSRHWATYSTHILAFFSFWISKFKINTSCNPLNLRELAFYVSSGLSYACNFWSFWRLIPAAPDHDFSILCHEKKYWRSQQNISHT